MDHTQHLHNLHDHAAQASPEGIGAFFHRLMEVYVPRQQCMYHEADVIWMHIIADALIALAYYSIPIALYYFVRRRKDLSYNWMFMMFAAFILACGTTHVFNIIAIWHPLYRLDGLIKLFTGLVSVATAAMLWPLIPRALALPSPIQMQMANQKLKHEIAERWQVQEKLSCAYEDLELRVQQRTAQLAESEARLREADRRKDEFLAMLAHELRNPLAPIRNAVHILRTFCNASCSISEQTARQRDMIERQVAHMSRLLDDLLDVSRITRGKINLRREKLDLRAVAAQAIESMRSLFEGRQQQFFYQASSQMLLVEGDPTRLEQVLRNLLHNAIKYTEPGGCIWMTLGLESEHEQSGWAVVRVRDSGNGITPGLIEHIFEPFVQAEQSLARTQGGLGIGLCMVKSLVELHGGRVEAQSAGLGQGSEFVVRLPLCAAVADKTVSSAGGEACVQDGVTNHPRRILVVDDNFDAAVSMSDLLEIWGHRVRTAGDGHQALAVAREWRPEVILLDIGLPGMDGYEVARRLRVESATADAFLVALTGYGTDEDRQRALEAGFDRHLTKPVELAALQALLA